MGKPTQLLSIAAAALCLINGAAATLDPIVIKGSKFFFKSNGTQFYIKGVAYQAGISSNGTTSENDNYTDPLADETTCTRDIPYLKKLGANTIRTYALDPTVDHSSCMSMLDAAGIYVISDLGEPKTSINRADPQWNVELYERYTSVVDSMAKYTNVIGFFAGNEVPNNTTYSGSSAFVKAAVRDTKAYIKSKNYRAMGVGYAADDDADVRANVAAYFNCGDSADQIDFWGYNIYEWCGDSSFTESGYDQRVKEFENYNVPTFFAEYGCNTPGGAAGRKFTEVAALYGDQMNDVFSGGIVYEYFQEDNDYGLVSVEGSSSVSTLADFAAFSSQIHKVDPTGVNSGSYNPTNTASSTCPTVDADWLAASSPLPPTPNTDTCDCMVASLSCTASSDLSSKEIGTLFAQVCGYNNGAACEGILRNTTTGTYGEYSMCNATQQLSFAFDAYYKSQKSDATSCDFDGKAQVVSAQAQSSCSAILKSASASAKSGGAAASSTTKNSDAGDSLVGASVGISRVWMWVFSTAAALSGVGMVLL